MLQNRFEKKLKSISIRGRFAFGVKCLEQYVNENNIEGKWIDKLLNTLWEFTTSERLDLWDEKINDLDPWNILDTHPENKAEGYKSLTGKEFYDLKDFYASLDKGFVEMIGNTIEIGTRNLYGGTGKFSNETLQPTLELTRVAKNLLNNIPKIEDFEFSRFSEQNGWGNKFDKEILKKNVW